MANSPRVRVYIACSLDGYIAGPQDDLSWLEPPADSTPQPTDAVEFGDFMAQIGAMLMGRRTYEVVCGFGEWPYGQTPVLVATHRALEPMVDTIQAIEGDIHQLVAQAKQLAGDQDVYLDGGGLIQQALAAGVVDELIITFAPILLGDGVRLFGDLDQRYPLEFVAHHTYGHMLQVVAKIVKPAG